MRPSGRTLPKATDKNDMYSREFPTRGNFLFFIFCKMSLFCLPCGKLPLAFLAVPTGKDSWVDCTGVEDALDVTMAQRSELDYLIYNDPLGYADLILNGDPEEYLKNVAGSHGLED